MSELVAKQLAGERDFTKERILRWWKENFEVKAANAVDRLRSGRITLAEFSEWGYDELKNTLYGIAGTGAGRKLTRKEIYQIRRVLKEQDKYWANFAQNIADQRKALAAEGLKGAEFDEAFDKLHDKWSRRAQSYSGAVGAEGTKWAMSVEFPDGSWWRWTKTPVESCETCIERDGKLYQMKDGRLPFYPKNGSTICLYNCKCFWDPVAKPPSGRRKKLGPMGARRKGKKLRQKAETEVFRWSGTVTCGICGRALTDPVSVMKGIGPVCEKHMGPGPHPSGSPQQVHAGESGISPVRAAWKVSGAAYREAFGKVTREEVETAFGLPGADTDLLIDEEGPGVRIICDWNDPKTGRRLGTCGRQLEHGLEFTKDPDNPTRLYKLWRASYMNFERDFQNKGHATSLYERQTVLAKKAGFEKIETNASGTIGRYAWSRSGYDYADPERAVKATTDFRAWAGRHGIDFLEDQWPDFKHASEVGSFRIPGIKFIPSKHAAFSNSDVPADMELNLGKAFMLDMGGYGHGTWRAVLDLREKHD